MEAVQQNMIANNLTPVYATHPGEIIKDELEFRGIIPTQACGGYGHPLYCPE